MMPVVRLTIAIGLILLAGGGMAGAQSPANAAESSAASVGPSSSAGQSTSPIHVPDLSRLIPNADSRESLSASLQIFLMMTILMVAPGILLMTTCFTRMLVVLVLLRQALGTQTLPPSQILVGLALFMTFLVMAPTWERIRTDGVQPYLDGRIEQTEAIAAAGGHLRSFMFDQIESAGNESDVYMMVEYAARRPLGPDETLTRDQVSTTALLPAYLLSELKTAFAIGFRIYLPFLVIDIVIATVLVSMGMMMLPPVLVSLPFKLLLFVLAGGWHLVAGSLMASVQ